MMFSAVMVVPPLFGWAVSVLGGYAMSYVAVAALALSAAAALAWPDGGGGGANQTEQHPR
jgi:hypothetical protein